MARIAGFALGVILLALCSTYTEGGRRGWSRNFYPTHSRLPARPRGSGGKTAPGSTRACEKFRKLPKKITTWAVFGGEVVKEAEFPYMAAVGYNSSSTKAIIWGCGGSLIHERYVLTAAHCIAEAERRGMFAAVLRLGTNLVADGAPLPSDYAVQMAIAHPRFDPKEKYHDVGLLRTDRPVRFSFGVRPVCLQPAGDPPPFPNTQVLVVGWGSTERSGVGSSERLLKAEVRVVGHKECRRRFESPRESSIPRGITKDMICAAHPKMLSGTCLGDSGGPLVLRDARIQEDTIIGITSFGQRPCGGLKPSVYSFVADSMAWIESVVWP